MGDQTSASSYDLRSMLADALPAAGPTRASVKAMHDIGYNADPKNNDMKELFVGLDLASGDDSSTTAKANSRSGSPTGGGPSGGGGGSALSQNESSGAGGGGARGPSAAQVLLDYRREQKAVQEAAAQEASRLVRAGATAAGVGKAVSKPGIAGVGLARAAGIAGLDVEEAAEDERHLRKVNLSKTAARMSSKQKRRRKQGRAHGEDYEERYTGKVLNKSKRKGRMLAMKQMY